MVPMMFYAQEIHETMPVVVVYPLITNQESFVGLAALMPTSAMVQRVLSAQEILMAMIVMAAEH
jgi:hypothetical protein